ncbi:MAG TPA: hypothetical protein VI432_01880 [Candidatus Paceibacterota bacterium]
MTILLYGPNSYLRLKKSNEIVDFYKKQKEGFNLDGFDLSDKEQFINFEERIRSSSMFSNNKFFIIQNVFDSDDKKELKKILKAHLEDEENVILMNSDIKPPADFKFLITKPAKSELFDNLKSDTEIIDFIKKEAEDRGVKLEDKDFFSLRQAFDNDLWAITTELDRLSLSESVRIEKKEKYEYFQILNALKYGFDARKKLIALEIILSDRRDEPARVFNSLSYGLKDQISINFFADLDIAVKSGKLEYEEVLLSFALI